MTSPCATSHLRYLPWLQVRSWKRGFRGLDGAAIPGLSSFPSLERGRAAGLVSPQTEGSREHLPPRQAPPSLLLSPAGGSALERAHSSREINHLDQMVPYRQALVSCISDYMAKWTGEEDLEGVRKGSKYWQGTLG